MFLTQSVSSSALSATDEAWRLLASYLDRYPSANAQHHRCVINKLLSHGVPLPDWLVKSYKVRQEGHGHHLVMMRAYEAHSIFFQAFILTCSSSLFSGFYFDMQLNLYHILTIDELN